jgi:hypothetical protein
LLKLARIRGFPTVCQFAIRTKYNDGDYTSDIGVSIHYRWTIRGDISYGFGNVRGELRDRKYMSREGLKSTS